MRSYVMAALCAAGLLLRRHPAPSRLHLYRSATQMRTMLVWRHIITTIGITIVTITTIVTAGGVTATVIAVGNDWAAQQIQFIVEDALARAKAARPARVSSVGFHPTFRSFPGSTIIFPRRRCHSSVRPSAAAPSEMNGGGTGNKPALRPSPARKAATISASVSGDGSATT